MGGTHPLNVDAAKKARVDYLGSYFRGTARIGLEHLDFKNLCLLDDSDAKAVARLKNCPKTISKNGLDPLDLFRDKPVNRIPALIDQNTLDAIAPNDKVRRALLKSSRKAPTTPKIPSKCSIRCLQGRGRVKALTRCPNEGRRWWWTVDFYLERGENAELAERLREEYSNPLELSDGDIFQMVRWYRKQRDQFREKYVWSRIKLDKNGDLRQLFTHKTLVDAFDALLVIPALLSEFKIEHDYLSLHCYEEYVYYLKGRVLKTWRDDICRGKERLMRSVDAEDVELVRLRAPAHSDKDLRDLKELFRERILFQAIENDSDRKEMWDGLRNVQNMILTLHTFFEDVKYLKHPAKAMMELISPLSQKEFRGTIYQSMQRIFDRTDTGNNVLIEETEGDFRKEQGSLRHRFQLGYRQLWLKPWRHWPELRGIGPQNESGEKPPIAPQRSTARWSEFASLAMKLGFRSPEISRHYTPDIAGEDGSARIDPPPLFVDGPGVILKQRCGPTSTEAYEADHPHLFYDTIHDLERGRGEDISSFFVRSSVYLSFFGWQTGNAKYFPFNEETDDGEFVPDESEPVRHRLPARVPEVGSHAPVTVDEPAPRDMPDAELPREISEILDIYHEPRTENPPGIEPSLDIPSSRHGDQDWQIASTAEAPGEQCWKDDESTLYDGSSDYERNSDYEGGTAYEGSVGDVREIDYGDCVGIPTEGDVIVSKEPSRSGVHAYQNPETSTPVGSPYFVIHWDGENVTRPRLPTLVDKNAVDSFAEREPGLLLTAHGRAMGPGQCGKAVEMDGTPAIVVAKGPKVVVSTLVIDKTRNLVRGAMTGWEDAMIEWNQSRKRQKVK